MIRQTMTNERNQVMRQLSHENSVTCKGLGMLDNGLSIASRLMIEENIHERTPSVIGDPHDYVIVVLYNETGVIDLLMLQGIL